MYTSNKLKCQHSRLLNWMQAFHASANIQQLLWLAISQTKLTLASCKHRCTKGWLSSCKPDQDEKPNWVNAIIDFQYNPHVSPQTFFSVAPVPLYYSRRRSSPKGQGSHQLQIWHHYPYYNVFRQDALLCLETDGIKWSQIRRIRWVLNKLKATFIKGSHCDDWLVDRSIVLVKENNSSEHSTPLQLYFLPHLSQ